MRVISGSARGKKLKELQGDETRPTIDRIKEALFSMLQFELPGRAVLDLFGGTGQLGIEALSRGAGQATFVDLSRESTALMRENLKHTQLEDKGRVVQADSITFLGTCKEKFDIILLDPPYESDLLEQAMQRIARFDILRENGIIVCESTAAKEVPTVTAPYVQGKTYKYGKIKLTVYRRQGSNEAT